MSRIAILLGLATFGCTGAGTADKNKANDDAKDAGDGPRPVDVARPAFQAKSSVQLQKSVEACVGKGALEISADMIAGDMNPQGFLTSDFAAGSDIVGVQTLLFDGTASSLRTGTRVDQITLEYVTALKNVANVVGSRCDKGSVTSPELCQCSTEADAKAMITRCLSAVVDPSAPEVADLAKAMSAKCAASRGSGIASMLSSLAFAKVP